MAPLHDEYDPVTDQFGSNLESQSVPSEEIELPQEQADASEDEDVEAYFNALMGRLGQVYNEPVRTPAPKQVPKEEPADEEVAADATPPAQAEPPKRPLRQPTPAPPVNLEGMREVANNSSRAAIDSSVRRQSIKSAYHHLLVSGIAIAVAYVLLGYTGNVGGWLAALASAICAVVAVMEAVKFYKIHQRFVASISGSTNLRVVEAEEPAQETPEN